MQSWGVRRMVPPTFDPPGTRLEIEVVEPAVKHVITLAQLQRSANGAAESPAVTNQKRATRDTVAVSRTLHRAGTVIPD
jgi:hypothetical protein